MLKASARWAGSGVMSLSRIWNPAQKIALVKTAPGVISKGLRDYSWPASPR